VSCASAAKRGETHLGTTSCFRISWKEGGGWAMVQAVKKVVNTRGGTWTLRNQKNYKKRREEGRPWRAPRLFRTVPPQAYFHHGKRSASQAPNSAPKRKGKEGSKSNFVPQRGAVMKTPLTLALKTYNPDPLSVRGRAKRRRRTRASFELKKSKFCGGEGGSNQKKKKSVKASPNRGKRGRLAL